MAKSKLTDRVLGVEVRIKKGEPGRKKERDKGAAVPIIPTGGDAGGIWRIWREDEKKSRILISLRNSYLKFKHLHRNLVLS